MAFHMINLGSEADLSLTKKQSSDVGNEMMWSMSRSAQTV